MRCVLALVAATGVAAADDTPPKVTSLAFHAGVHGTRFENHGEAPRGRGPWFELSGGLQLGEAFKLVGYAGYIYFSDPETVDPINFQMWSVREDVFDFGVRATFMKRRALFGGVGFGLISERSSGAFDSVAWMGLWCLEGHAGYTLYEKRFAIDIQVTFESATYFNTDARMYSLRVGTGARL